QAHLDIPVGRYALSSPAPESHRQIIDSSCGSRPPRQGFVQHDGNVSWAIGRQGFIRGKASGSNMIESVSQMYELDADATYESVADSITDPKSASDFNAPVFSFFSEVSPASQLQFVQEMGVDADKVCAVADQFSNSSGYALPSAA
ncbi:hypothetical protein OY671_009495, partial [Metschnikowia pulcherrima]